MLNSSLPLDLTLESIPRLLVHGGAGDAPGGGLAGLVERFLEAATQIVESGGTFDLFPGIQTLGANIHPLIVHFPVALLSAFLLTELLGVSFRSENLRKAASGMLYLGTISALAAVAAGLVAEDTVPHGESVHDIMAWHARLGFTVTGLALALTIWRLLSRSKFSGMGQALHLFLAVIMVGCLVFGADLGGLMVYQHGVGVKNLQQADDHHHHGSPASDPSAHSVSPMDPAPLHRTHE